MHHNSWVSKTVMTTMPTMHNKSWASETVMTIRNSNEVVPDTQPIMCPFRKAMHPCKTNRASWASRWVNKLEIQHRWELWVSSTRTTTRWRQMSRSSKSSLFKTMEAWPGQMTLFWCSLGSKTCLVSLKKFMWAIWLLRTVQRSVYQSKCLHSSLTVKIGTYLSTSCDIVIRP